MTADTDLRQNRISGFPKALQCNLNIPASVSPGGCCNITTMAGRKLVGSGVTHRLLVISFGEQGPVGVTNKSLLCSAGQSWYPVRPGNGNIYSFLVILKFFSGSKIPTDQIIFNLSIEWHCCWLAVSECWEEDD